MLNIEFAFDMTERKHLSELRTLSAEGAIALREAALENARENGVEGFLIIFDARGLQLTSEGLGRYNETNIVIALAKAKTVLSIHRSTSVQRERMESKGQKREDFGDRIGSLFGGGVAVFADEAKIEFVGAMAFSGGTEEQDENICRTAVDSLGLYTDLTPEILATTEGKTESSGEDTNIPF